MNLLEQYLREVHSVEKYESEWTKEEWAKDKEFLMIYATFECYGNVRREKHIFTAEQWEQIKEKGYYLG